MRLTATLQVFLQALKRGEIQHNFLFQPSKDSAEQVVANVLHVFSALQNSVPEKNQGRFARLSAVDTPFHES